MKHAQTGPRQLEMRKVASSSLQFCILASCQSLICSLSSIWGCNFRKAPDGKSALCHNFYGKESCIFFSRRAPVSSQSRWNFSTTVSYLVSCGSKFFSAGYSRAHMAAMATISETMFRYRPHDHTHYVESLQRQHYSDFGKAQRSSSFSESATVTCRSHALLCLA